MKYFKKAIKLSESPPAEYFLALGDSQFEEGIREDPTGMKSLYYMAAKMSYENVFKMTYPIYDHFDIIA